MSIACFETKINTYKVSFIGEKVVQVIKYQSSQIDNRLSTQMGKEWHVRTVEALHIQGLASQT